MTSEPLFEGVTASKCTVAAGPAPGQVEKGEMIWKSAQA